MALIRGVIAEVATVCDEDGLDIDPEATVYELKNAFQAKKAKYYTSRQRFTLPPAEGEKRGVALEDDRTLASYGIKDGAELLFKDLGPQVGYATVFLWEYLGPLMVYPMFYFLPQIYWWNDAPLERNPIQTMAMAFWSLHYSKRLYETFFVHRFSHGTMPIRNLFKNCGYYWGFAAYVSYFVNHPLYTPPYVLRGYVLFPIAVGCELANLRCHLIQRRLRAPGEKGYKIPRGFLFDYITCANYTTEIASWLLFSIATQTFTSLLFTLAGAIQMAQWANGKHKRLVKMFDGQEGRPKYPKRWKMIPFLF